MDLVQFLDMIVHVDKTLGILIEQYGTLVYAVLFAIIFVRQAWWCCFSSPATPCCL